MVKINTVAREPSCETAAEPSNRRERERGRERKKQRPKQKHGHRKEGFEGIRDKRGQGAGKPTISRFRENRVVLFVAFGITWPNVTTSGRCITQFANLKVDPKFVERTAAYSEHFYKMAFPYMRCVSLSQPSILETELRHGNSPGNFHIPRKKMLTRSASRQNRGPQLIHPTVGMQRKFAKLLTRGASLISHPRHGFKSIRSIYPTNLEGVSRPKKTYGPKIAAPTALYRTIPHYTAL